MLKLQGRPIRMLSLWTRCERTKGYYQTPSLHTAEQSTYISFAHQFFFLSLSFMHIHQTRARIKAEISRLERSRRNLILIYTHTLQVSLVGYVFLARQCIGFVWASSTLSMDRGGEGG